MPEAEHIPPGYSRHFRTSNLTNPWEPLYSNVFADRVKLAVRLRGAHCNSRGFAHGGLIGALADNAMGLSCAQIMKGANRKLKGLVTISQTTDFMGVGEVGQWLEIDTDYVKCGGSICFARSLILANDVIIAKAGASFKIL